MIMQIIYKKEDFLYTLFPELTNGDEDLIKSTLSAYYSYGDYKPTVKIENEFIIIELDTTAILSHESDFNRVIAFCERGNYTDAKPLLTKIIAQNPTNSEYHRIMGQILSDEGDQEEAINCLIDALRWDSKNPWALIMMGNIFAKFKKDIPVAMKYYDLAVLAKPEDHTAIYNIGALLMKQGNTEEAKKYLLESLKINPAYPNTHYVQALIAEKENDLYAAFDSAIDALKYNKNKDSLYENSVRLAFDMAKRILPTEEGKKTYQAYRQKLESAGGTVIDIFEDTDIRTAAKIEFAETYQRTNHTVRFKPGYPAVEHLVMHELVHLDFVIQARKEGVNKLFISRPQQKADFKKAIDQVMEKLKKRRVPENEITNYSNSLFDGINLQAYNAPIDLFIEDYLYTEYPNLRPYQFISNYNLLLEAIKAVTDKKILEFSPKEILSKSKMYNLVNALQFNDLFGIDLIPDYNPRLTEIKQAQTFYTEYLEYKDDRHPAEEYELVQLWGNDLKLNRFFELVDEVEFLTKKQKEKEFQTLIDSAALANPATTGDKDTEMSRFLASQKEKGTNTDIVKFMVEALQFFESMPLQKIKEIAFEIAFKGAQGYNPINTGYTIDLMPGKVFTGYQILAYYYVSFALGAPEVLMEIQLPYHEEFLLAKSMRNRRN